MTYDAQIDVAEANRPHALAAVGLAKPIVVA